MWTRGDLKNKAKNVLRNIYWKAFLISMVIVFATGLGGGGGGGGGGNFGSSSNSNEISTGLLITVIFVILIVLAIAILFAIAFRVFLGYPLEVGGRKYFIQSAQDKDNKKCFRFAFYGYNYKGVILTMLYKGVLNFLWYLLFIIPGIVKSYSYSMVPYILADNPNIGYKRAVDLSKNLTYGHKWRMFVLDLSFIGWALLGLLCCGVGILFLLPYINATKAELYLTLRQDALDNGLCRYEELLLSMEEAKMPIDFSE